MQQCAAMCSESPESGKVPLVKCKVADGGLPARRVVPSGREVTPMETLLEVVKLATGLVSLASGIIRIVFDLRAGRDAKKKRR